MTESELIARISPTSDLQRVLPEDDIDQHADCDTTTMDVGALSVSIRRVKLSRDNKEIGRKEERTKRKAS